ncbi:hypothetical protein LIER_01020 [Lithospermum erythrorhizon]|uniref:Integrase catalytic domain-containing protein n=1 Tax=Lithospermum erythrorhizon TaxID=34254 RepID=A0AAV3NJZ7_LITER
MCYDYSRYTWVEFIKEKSDTFDVLKKLIVQLQKENEQHVVQIRSDHGKKFENSKFAEFCATKGITHEFSSPITPQQNGVVERKNRTIQEMAHVMLHAKNIPLKFGAEAINIACHIHNLISLRPVLKPIAYPSLLCSIIESQHSDILTAADDEGPTRGLLTINPKLLQGTHDADIPLPTVETGDASNAGNDETARFLRDEIKHLEGVIQTSLARKSVLKGKT